MKQDKKYRAEKSAGKGLRSRKKVVLLRGAARLGPNTLIKQAWLALADSFVRKRHLVFRLDASECEWLDEAVVGCAQLREFVSAKDIPPNELAWLNDSEDFHDWGSFRWLEQGWHLWLLQENEQILTLAWTRASRQSRDFFVPMKEKEELFWHVYVLPQYRGRNLQKRIWSAIACRRAAEGVTGFFTNCRDYNLPSRANIEKMGFLCVGHCDESRITRRRSWHAY